MDKDREEELRNMVVSFGTIVFEKENGKVLVLFCVGPSEHVFLGATIKMSYKKLFFKLGLTGGRFAPHTFRHTQGHDEVVVVKTNVVSELMHELATSGEGGFDSKGLQVKLNAKIAAMEKEGAAEEVIRELQDLQVRLNNNDTENPEWQISQYNTDKPLALDPKNVLELATLEESNDETEVSGFFYTSGENYDVDISATGINQLNPAFWIRWRLAERVLRKRFTSATKLTYLAV